MQSLINPPTIQVLGKTLSKYLTASSAWKWLSYCVQLRLLLYKTPTSYVSNIGLIQGREFSKRFELTFRVRCRDIHQ
jgi:hypothetical protein